MVRHHHELYLSISLIISKHRMSSYSPDLTICGVWFGLVQFLSPAQDGVCDGPIFLSPSVFLLTDQQDERSAEGGVMGDSQSPHSLELHSPTARTPLIYTLPGCRVLTSV